MDNPVCEKIVDLGIKATDLDDENDTAMEVVPPELSPDMSVDILLSLPAPHKQLQIINVDKVQKIDLSNAPFKKIRLSPLGNAIATFTEQGGLWVVKSDFTENHPEFTTRSKAPPAQICWCGEDSVCLYWEPEQLNRDISLFLMIGPNGDYYKKTYEGPIHMVTEIDGIRIISNSACEFMQKVPQPTLEIFRIGSLEPAAMLFDAYKEFEKKNASSIKNIRAIKSKLPKAVITCLKAACYEFDPDLQRKLLKAAAYGKSFCETFKHNEFMQTCKKLRVMNAVRAVEVGIPITYEQFDRLTQEVLIDRLVNRFHHFLAYRICEYLELKSENVLVHWACSKVKSYAADLETTLNDKQILESIRSKLSKVENASYAVVASTAYQVGKKDLAIALLEFEKNTGEQVPLLLEMKEVKKALKKAIESGETDLVYLVLLHMKKKLPTQTLFQIINEQGFEIAKSLLVTYCKEQDLDFLTSFYQALEQPHEAASMLVMEAFRLDDLNKKKKALVQAKDLYSKNKLYLVDSRGAETQANLFDYQTELDKEFGKPFYVGLTMSETIYNLILQGQDLKASKCKTQFYVSDKLYWSVKIEALAKTHRWEDLEKFSKKKSPIGYRPFVEVCLKYDQYKVQAAKYIPKITDDKEKVEMYVQISKFKEAIETAFAMKDIDLLLYIRSRSGNAQTKTTIDGLLQKLGA